MAIGDENVQIGSCRISLQSINQRLSTHYLGGRASFSYALAFLGFLLVSFTYLIQSCFLGSYRSMVAIPSRFRGRVKVRTLGAKRF
jgi:hypothetical protein